MPLPSAWRHISVALQMHLPQTSQVWLPALSSRGSPQPRAKCRLCWVAAWPPLLCIAMMTSQTESRTRSCPPGSRLGFELQTNGGPSLICRSRAPFSIPCSFVPQIFQSMGERSFGGVCVATGKSLFLEPLSVFLLYLLCFSPTTTPKKDGDGERISPGKKKKKQPGQVLV